jgi:D-3-phosphoglycerate dehydrogenase
LAKASDNTYTVSGLENGDYSFGVAALDVYEIEPPLNSLITPLKNVICTPHIGAGSVEAQIGNSTVVAEKLINFFNS